MPIKISDDTKYVNGVFTYILHITNSLINEQKIPYKKLGYVFYMFCIRF